jgi:hypothetical protein
MPDRGSSMRGQVGESRRIGRISIDFGRLSLHTHAMVPVSRFVFAAGVLLLGSGGFVLSRAQANLAGGIYTLFGHASAGGGASGAAGYSVSGELGVTASGVSSGGNFSLISGVSRVVPRPTGPVEIAIRASQSQVELSWPVTAVGYVLESSPSIGSGALWQPVSPAPTQTTHTVVAAQTARFYRLRKD